MNEDYEVVDRQSADMVITQNVGGLASAADTDNILYLAERAEQYVAAINRIMEAALKITNERD